MILPMSDGPQPRDPRRENEVEDVVDLGPDVGRTVSVGAEDEDGFECGPDHCTVQQGGNGRGYGIGLASSPTSRVAGGLFGAPRSPSNKLTTLDPAEAKRILHDAGVSVNGGDLQVRQVSVSRSYTWMVRVGSELFVIQKRSDPWAFHRCVQAADLLPSRTGLPVPEIVFYARRGQTSDGSDDEAKKDFYVEVPSDESVLVTRWVDGELLSSVMDESPANAVAGARILACIIKRFQEIRSDISGQLGVGFKRQWVEVQRSRLETIAKNEFVKSYCGLSALREVGLLLRQRPDQFTWSGEAAFVASHGDLQPSNILVRRKADGRLDVVSVLDFEDFGFAPTFVDVGFVGLWVLRDRPELFEAFYDDLRWNWSRRQWLGAHLEMFIRLFEHSAASLEHGQPGSGQQVLGMANSRTYHALKALAQMRTILGIHREER